MGFFLSVVENTTSPQTALWQLLGRMRASSDFNTTTSALRRRSFVYHDDWDSGSVDVDAEEAGEISLRHDRVHSSRHWEVFHQVRMKEIDLNSPLGTKIKKMEEQRERLNRLRGKKQVDNEREEESEQTDIWKLNSYSSSSSSLSFSNDGVPFDPFESRLFRRQLDEEFS